MTNNIVIGDYKLKMKNYFSCKYQLPLQFLNINILLIDIRFNVEVSHA